MFLAPKYTKSVMRLSFGFLLFLSTQHSTASSLTDSPANSLKGFDQSEIHEPKWQAPFQIFEILPISLEFNKHWYRENRFEMSKSDEKRIRKEYTELLRDELSKALEKTATLSNEPANQQPSLRLDVSLSQFRITAPDLSFKPRTKDFVDHVGASKIQVNIINSATGQVLASLTDYSETRAFAGLNDFKQTNRVQNKHDFKMLFRRWSQAIAGWIALQNSSIK